MTATNLDGLAARLGEQLAALPDTRRAEIECAMGEGIDGADLASLQDIQAWAFAAQLITLDAAQWLYSRLGGEAPTPERWRTLPLPERVLVFTTCQRLLEAKARAA